MVLYLIYFLVGIIFTFMVLKNPENFFKIFLVSIIIGSGAKIEGYPVLDEFLVIMLLFGLFLRKFLIKRLNTEKKKR